MINKYSLFVIAFLCSFLSGFGQGSESFNNLNAVSGSYGNNSYLGDNGVTWTYGEGRLVTATYNITGTSIGLNQTGAGIGPRYVSASSGANGVGNLNYSIRSYFTGGLASDRTIEVYVNGALVETFTLSAVATVYNRSVTVNQAGNVLIEFRSTGTRQLVLDNISWTIASTTTVDFCNLQSPASGNTTVGTVFNVYAQVYKAGVTEPAGAGAGITGWIGYSTVNNNPNTAGWTWKPATFNVQVGNNDEYIANIGTLPTLASGTYYYASRFQINGGPFSYGGLGGFWSITARPSGVLSIDTPDFVNLQFPENGTIELGGNHDVYGQVYEQGVTPGAGQGSNIQSEVGYRLNGTLTTNPNGASWTWISANYNPSCMYDTCNGNQNDEYFINLGAAINVPGTYSYATRFRINGGAWIYGGIAAGGTSGGGIWNGTTFRNGMLTINEPPLANVVITEIMYNTPGADDEWIEICNVSGSSQYLGNYKVKYNGSTLFTFPTATYISSGTCITVALGTDGNSVFNDLCPFTPTFGNPVSTNNLANGTVGYTISLIATNNTTVIDSVTYSSADGADGTGASLHVTNISLDNSNTSSNWQEVIDGGSPGTNSLISPCTPVESDIKVRGNLGTFPLIANGDMTPQGTDNTLFAAQFVGSTGTKSYRVHNQGILNLTISSITVTGANPGDFTVSVMPSTTIAPGSFSIMEIEFTPLAAGVRNATVNIASNDPNDNPYIFAIQGTGNCVATSYTAIPNSGPVGTITTVTGTNFAASTTVTINGISAFKTVLNATTMEVTIPSGAATGNIVIVNSLGCTSNVPFTVIDNQIAGCEGSVNLSDLIISEITDATVGGVSYIEIYNGTGATRALGGYSIGIYSNGEATPSSTVNLNSVNLANNTTYLVAIGIASPVTSTNTCSQTGGNGQLANQLSGVSGINKKDNEHDMIRLLKSSGTVVVDAFGVYQDSNWMDATIVTGDRGFNFRRINTSSPLPNPTFNINQWNVIDWVGSGLSSCGTNDYSNLGVYDFSRGVPPTVTLQPLPPVLDCDLKATLKVGGSEGFAGSQPLAYQWYYNAPNTNNWVAILNTDSNYTGQQGPTLYILNTLNLNEYQFYCQIRESGATCFKASNAVRLTVRKTTWNGTAWDPITPTSNTIALIDGNYNTGVGGVQTSFQACQLIVNAAYTLTVADNTFVEIQNNVTNDGRILVNKQGSFVQVEDDGTITLNNPNARNIVSKFTTPLINWYDYTYWSSPLVNAQIETALSFSKPSRRFGFNASQFNDVRDEIDNTGTFVTGSDDIDDEGDDWFNQQTGRMIPGMGYAATHNTIGFIPNTSYQYIFEGSQASGGVFNTGDIPVDIYITPTSGPSYNNWNLLGNPYPSAIEAGKFFLHNIVSLEGVIYFWSHRTPPSSTASGNENLNFSQNDYAILNHTGGTGTSGNSSVSGSTIPNGYIPSGQGFFVIGKKTAATAGPDYYTKNVFTNAMRSTSNNSQFFRTSNSQLNDKLWLNLTSNNGVFSQILIGYVPTATNEFDGMHFDAFRNLSTASTAILYSIIPNTDKKFAIQGRDPMSLSIEEQIPLGFQTLITQQTNYSLSIQQLEGDFLSSNTIYLKDNLLNLTHNLSTSDYTFTSQPGEFNNRFEIVFQDQSLSVIENEITPDGLSIIELPNGQVKFLVGNNLDILKVEIIDMLGRTLYNLKGNSPSEVYELSNLSQAAYMAKVSLSNGQVITKRAVKRF